MWTPDELAEAVGPELGAVAADWYGVTEAGNFEGRTILRRPAGCAVAAARRGRRGAAPAVRGARPAGSDPGSTTRCSPSGTPCSARRWPKRRRPRAAGTGPTAAVRDRRVPGGPSAAAGRRTVAAVLAGRRGPPPGLRRRLRLGGRLLHPGGRADRRGRAGSTRPGDGPLGHARALRRRRRRCSSPPGPTPSPSSCGPPSSSTAPPRRPAPSPPAPCSGWVPSAADDELTAAGRGPARGRSPGGRPHIRWPPPTPSPPAGWPAAASPRWWWPATGPTSSPRSGAGSNRRPSWPGASAPPSPLWAGRDDGLAYVCRRYACREPAATAGRARRTARRRDSHAADA